MKRFMVLAAVALVVWSGRAIGADEVTTKDLLDEMVSLEWLTHSLPPGTLMVQFSSYDRASKVENGETVGMKNSTFEGGIGTPSERLGWWANLDLGNYLREEDTPRGTEWVMAEADGPGAIVRLWSANPGTRRWRIYIDGATEPTIEARGSDLLGGRVKPWGEAFSQKRNFGANLIFPIAFAKSVKVTVAKRDSGGGKAPMMYYHVNLRLFPAGTAVRPFSWDEVNGLAAEIERVGTVIADPDTMAEPPGKREEFELSVAPGSEAEVFRLAGPGEVVRLEMEVIENEREIAGVLGRTLLMMDWDGETGVRTPLGDFFGSSPGVNEMKSLPFTIRKTERGAGFTSRFPMPYQREAVITVKNLSARRLALRAAAVIAPREWSDDSLYFRADWRQWNKIETRPFHDLPMVVAQGRGKFVGLEMNVRNPMEFFWWGEGDEKVWVNGEEFPSIFGTGTEDYFGYAWCVQYFKFTHAYHGVSLPTREWLAIPQVAGIPYFWEWLSNATARQAVVSQYRFQILDTIPFEQGLKFDMELWHHRSPAVDVNATAYWYSAPGAASDAVVEDLGERQVWKTD